MSPMLPVLAPNGRPMNIRAKGDEIFLVNLLRLFIRFEPSFRSVHLRIGAVRLRAAMNDLWIHRYVGA